MWPAVGPRAARPRVWLVLPGLLGGPVVVYELRGDGCVRRTEEPIGSVVRVCASYRGVGRDATARRQRLAPAASTSVALANALPAAVAAAVDAEAAKRATSVCEWSA